ncbi:hypothetical protein SAY86_026957 [Trapa natans]|uniref:RING-type domain-containing protein n=1 Tax=Trapa natans TaxID=22666 RepID=A0AAN7KLQ0_TRANT|nr:hypothetical protein SAY86_026957 [Trapa natans]
MENNTKLVTPSHSDSDDNRSDGENPNALNGAGTVAIVQDVEGGCQEKAKEHGEDHEGSRPNGTSSSRTPFTDLSQVDADWALAVTLQEQERAYMMLRMNAEGSDYGSWEAASYLPDEEDDFDDPNDESDLDGEEELYDGTYSEEVEDAVDVHDREEAVDDDNSALSFDPDVFSSDEAYARALQDAEEREIAARMLALAGINDREVADSDDLGGQIPDTWEEVDPDELSYEELLALGEVVGSESRGLSADTIASLPSVSFTAGGTQHGSCDSCVICRLDYEDGETLTILTCKHTYHSECINNWLKINKVCPVCSTEVGTAKNS